MNSISISNLINALNNSNQSNVSAPFILSFASDSRCSPYFHSSRAKRLAKRLALCSALVVPALAAPMLFGVGPAYAACDPVVITGNVVNDVVATCTGDTVNQNTPDGYGSGVQNFTSITVEPGATVTGDADGIDVNNIITFINNGTITGGTVGATAFDGFGATNVTSATNNGSITGDGNGIDANAITSLTNNGVIIGTTLQGVDADTIASLINSGTIRGGFDGVQASTLTYLRNSDTITGGNDGLGIANIGTLINSGTISGGDDGIHAIGFGTSIASLINSGTISGVDDGVFASGDITTLTNSGTISGGGDDGVRAAGSITSLVNSGIISAGDDGVAVTNSITSLINSGTIRVSDGGNGHGVLAGAAIGTLINSGDIIGGAEEGVQAITIGTLTNSGLITADEEGVFATTIDRLTNSGTISGGGNGVRATNMESFFNSGTIDGGGDDGVFVQSIISLTNTGIITGAQQGVDARDIDILVNHGTITGTASIGFSTSSSANPTVINSGTISGATDGIDAVNIPTLVNSGTITGGEKGVDVFSTLTSLTNSGTISGGATQDAIEANEITSLINSGTISGGTFAIEEISPTHDTFLTLNAGSILIGRVDLGGGVNTLNIGEGLSLNSMFEDPDGTSVVPILGTTSGHLVAFLDQANGGGGTDRQVVAVDPSAFASFDDALAALVSGIGQTVQGRQAALRADPALGFSSSFASRYAAAEETSLSAFSDLDLEDTPHLNPSRFWVEGFGAYRQGQSDRVGGDFDSLTGGLVAGVDVPVDALTSVGVMAGFAASTSENEIDTQQTDSMSYYAGVYASTQALGLAWDASLTAGYSDYSQERVTANNLVAAGLETASADFGGWFINPQVTMTREASNPLAGIGFGALMGTQTLEQSLTLSYAGLFLDGYTETGTTNPLTLDDRSIHVTSARAALALPFEAIHADGALTTLRLIGGVEARTQFGDNGVSGTLLGQTVSTTLDDDDAVLGGFLGLSGEYQTTTGLTAYANVEGLVEADASWQLSANAGLRMAF